MSKIISMCLCFLFKKCANYDAHDNIKKILFVLQFKDFPCDVNSLQFLLKLPIYQMIHSNYNVVTLFCADQKRSRLKIT